MFFPRMKWVKKTRNCPFYKFRMEIKTPLFTWTTFHFTSPISASKLCMYSWYLRKGFQINPFLFTNLTHIFPQWTFLGIHEPTVTTVYGISHVYTIINHLRHGKKEKKKKAGGLFTLHFLAFFVEQNHFDTFWHVSSFLDLTSKHSDRARKMNHMPGWISKAQQQTKALHRRMALSRSISPSPIFNHLLFSCISQFPARLKLPKGS